MFNGPTLGQAAWMSDAILLAQVAYQDLQMSLEGGDPQAETPETAAGAASSQDVGPSAISKPGLAGTTEPRQMAAGPLGAPAAA